ncbi:hypothetical protein Misp05_64800 [Micromonospora sp. NBRC 107095]|nr:hypothetical protein Misp05_64800 [Micromonospora sp. NBRC 107095]
MATGSSRGSLLRDTVRAGLAGLAVRRIWCGEADRVRFTTGREPGETAGHRSGRSAESDDLTQRFAAA